MSMPGQDGHTIMMGGVGPSWLPLVLLVPAAAVYGLGVVRLTRQGHRWPVTRSWAAVVGFAVLAAAMMPPLVSSRNFPVSVTQHLMLAMLAPLLLALSAPVTLALRTLTVVGRRRLLSVLHSRVARILTFAPVIFILDVGGMYAYYLSPLYAASHAHPWLHLTADTHMFLAGCLLSWYLIGRDPMPRRPSTRTTLIMLILAAGSHDLLSKLMYAHLLPHDSGTADQIRAGSHIMFYGGDAIDLALAVAIMLTWYARSGRQLAHDDRRRVAATDPGR